MKSYNYSILLLLFAITIWGCEKNDIGSTTPEDKLDPDKLLLGVSATVNELNFSSVSDTTAGVGGSTQDTLAVQQPDPFYATYGSDSSSLIILADGNLNAQDSVKWAQILLWVTGFNGKDVYNIEDGKSIAVFSIVDSTYTLR